MDCDNIHANAKHTQQRKPSLESLECEFDKVKS